MAQNYDQKFLYKVLVDGIALAQFKTCGPLEKTAETVEEGEGGALTNHKLAGKIAVSNVTLTKGKTDDETMHLWFKAAAITGESGGKVVTIVQTNRAGLMKRGYLLYDAFPVRYKQRLKNQAYHFFTT